MDTWRTGPTPHPSGDALEEYVFHRLPELQTSQLEDHILICGGCREALEETERFIRAAKFAAAEYQTHSGPRWPGSFHQPWLWKGAAVTIMVALAILIPWHRGPIPLPAPVELAALRGGSLPMAHAPTNAELDLKIDLTGLPAPATYRVEIVDAEGRPAWTGTAAARERILTTHVAKRLSQGVYWVRLYSESAELLREFGLKLG